MSRIYIIRKLVNIFDHFQQKKIFNFLRNKINSRSVLFDVGAHHGETIENFKKNFDFKEIHSFEASRKNFSILKKNIKDLVNSKIIINDFGLSDQNKEVIMNQLAESSSSTLSRINKESKYYKKKIRVLGVSGNNNYCENFKVKLITLDNYLKKIDIDKIDLLKIDTEGHEYYVLKGSQMNLFKVRYVYFEHHYDDMLEKKYKFSEIHNFLTNNNFKKVFKSKMFFRKTFEYIYENSKFY